MESRRLSPRSQPECHVQGNSSIPFFLSYKQSEALQPLRHTSLTLVVMVLHFHFLFTENFPSKSPWKQGYWRHSTAPFPVLPLAWCLLHMEYCKLSSWRCLKARVGAGVWLEHQSVWVWHLGMSLWCPRDQFLEQPLRWYHRGRRKKGGVGSKRRRKREEGGRGKVGREKVRERVKEGRRKSGGEGKKGYLGCRSVLDHFSSTLNSRDEISRI